MSPFFVMVDNPGAKQEFRSFNFTSSGSTTVTYPSQDIGTPEFGRYVVVFVNGLRNIGVTVNTLTIGGITATNLGQTTSLSGQATVACFIALVPSAFSADIVINFSTTTSSSISVYKVTGLMSPTPISVITDSSAGAINPTIPCENNGVILAHESNGGVFVSYSWGGLVENVDQTWFDSWTTSDASKNIDAGGVIPFTSTPSSGSVPHRVFMAISLR